MRTCRPTVGSAPSRLVTCPRDTLVGSTNISRRRLPGPRSGLVGHRSWSPTNNHHNRISTRTQSGIVVGCASPKTTDQLHLPGPRNGLVGACRRSRPTIIPNCYPQVTRADALIVLNAGTAGLKHLPDFSIGTADLVELRLLHLERVKRRPCPTHGLL